MHKTKFNLQIVTFIGFKVVSDVGHPVMLKIHTNRKRQNTNSSQRLNYFVRIYRYKIVYLIYSYKIVYLIYRYKIVYLIYRYKIVYLIASFI